MQSAIQTNCISQELLKIYMVSPPKTGGARITNIETPPADDYMYVVLSVFLIWQLVIFLLWLALFSIRFARLFVSSRPNSSLRTQTRAWCWQLVRTSLRNPHNVIVIPTTGHIFGQFLMSAKPAPAFADNIYLLTKCSLCCCRIDHWYTAVAKHSW